MYPHRLRQERAARALRRKSFFSVEKNCFFFRETSAKKCITSSSIKKTGTEKFFDFLGKEIKKKLARSGSSYVWKVVFPMQWNFQTFKLSLRLERPAQKQLTEQFGYALKAINSVLKWHRRKQRINFRQKSEEKTFLIELVCAWTTKSSCFLRCEVHRARIWSIYISAATISRKSWTNFHPTQVKVRIKFLKLQSKLTFMDEILRFAGIRVTLKSILLLLIRQIHQ
jgi:hypothetical protein